MRSEGASSETLSIQRGLALTLVVDLEGDIDGLVDGEALRRKELFVQQEHRPTFLVLSVDSEEQAEPEESFHHVVDL